MIMEKYFFEIPIFRCTREQFAMEVEADKQKRIGNLKSANEDIADKLAEIKYDYEKIAQIDTKFSSYRYGELVGMIRLFAITGQIRGELYFVSKRVSKVSINKMWILKERKIFELWIRRSDTNKSIFERILKQIAEYQNKSKLLFKCHIDIECFNAIGENINFIALTDMRDK